MIAESLTDALIEKQKIDKWNGDVPVVSGDSSPIVSIGGVTSNGRDLGEVGREESTNNLH